MQEDYYSMHFIIFIVQPAVQKETLLLLLLSKKERKEKERQKERKRKKERKVIYSPASSPSCSNRGPSVTVRKL